MARNSILTVLGRRRNVQCLMSTVCPQAPVKPTDTSLQMRTRAVENERFSTALFRGVAGFEALRFLACKQLIAFFGIIFRFLVAVTGVRHRLWLRSSGDAQRRRRRFTTKSDRKQKLYSTITVDD